MRRYVVKLVQRIQLDIASKDISLDPVWECFLELVAGVHTDRNSKYVVQLLQGALLSLWN